MKLPLTDAGRCIRLLDSLDRHAITTLKIFKNSNILDADYDFTKRRRARSIWQETPNFIEDFINAEPKLSDEDIQILRGWIGKEYAVYILIKYSRTHGIFMSVDLENPKHYGVLGLTDSIKKVCPYALPVMLRTTLLPYKGQIIWDGLINVINYHFDKKDTQKICEWCNNAEKENRIAFQF